MLDYMMTFQDFSLTLIELSNICNLRCTYCANRTSTRPTGRMLPLNFMRVLSQVYKRHGYRSRDFRISLHGFGEPSINPSLKTYLNILDAWGFSNVDFSTNGMELEHIIELIWEFSCLSWVRVSLQSCVKETMESMNVGADFDKVVTNIRLLIAADPSCRVVVQHAICPATEGETQEDMRRLIGPGKWEYMRKELHTQCGQAPDGPAMAQVSCAGGYGSRLVIHWDGDLVGCCSDNTKQQVYANAFRDGIYSEKTLAARRRLISQFDSGDLSELPLCRQCLDCK